MVYFLLFWTKSIWEIKACFSIRNKQIAQSSCIAYCIPRMTDACKEGAKIHLIPLQIRIMIHKPRLCLRAPDVLERIVIWRIKI